MRPTGTGKSHNCPTMAPALWSYRARATLSKVATCLVLQSSRDTPICKCMPKDKKETLSKQPIAPMPHQSTNLIYTLLSVLTKLMLLEDRSTAMELVTIWLREDLAHQQPDKWAWTSVIFSKSTTTKRKTPTLSSKCANPWADSSTLNLLLAHPIKDATPNIPVRWMKITKADGKQKNLPSILEFEHQARRTWWRGRRKRQPGRSNKYREKPEWKFLRRRTFWAETTIATGEDWPRRGPTTDITFLCELQSYTITWWEHICNFP